MDRIGHPQGNALGAVVTDGEIARLGLRRGNRRIVRHIGAVVDALVGGQFGPRVVHHGRNRILGLREGQVELQTAVKRNPDRRRTCGPGIVLGQIEIDDIGRGDQRTRTRGRVRIAGGPAPAAALGDSDRIGGSDGSGEHDPGIRSIAGSLERGVLRFQETRAERRTLPIFRRAAADRQCDEHQKEGCETKGATSRKDRNHRQKCSK